MNCSRLQTLLCRLHGGCPGRERAQVPRLPVFGAFFLECRPYWPSLSLRIIATDSLLGASLHLRPATIAALRHRASRPSARRREGRTRTAARARRDP